MQFAKVVFLCCAVTFCAGAYTSYRAGTPPLYKEDVTIAVYYETLCPYCRSFFSEQLIPTLDDLGPYINLQLIPYGNVEVKSDGSLACQHGLAECYGNTLHACTIYFVGNQIVSAGINNCMMETEPGSDDNTLTFCAEKYGQNPGPIIQCANSPLGASLIDQHGQATRAENINGVPHVTLNGIVSDDAIGNLKGEVCKYLSSTPPECYQ